MAGVILILELIANPANIIPKNSSSVPARAKAIKWRQIQPGLDYYEFKVTPASTVGDSKIRVLRISPKYFTFHMVNASSPSEGGLMSVRQWAKKHSFTAAINASMYQSDHFTSVSLMKNGKHINNPHVSKHKTVFAFSTRSPKNSRAVIYDRECDNFGELKKKYHSYVQSIRMISCQGKNVWKKQPASFSTAAIANDKNGNILFIHVRAPFSTHNLINHLLGLPLDIRTAMYVEGGHQAQLYVKMPQREYVLLGRYRSHFSGQAKAKFGWPIPNVIGIRPRKLANKP